MVRVCVCVGGGGLVNITVILQWMYTAARATLAAPQLYSGNR